MFRHKLRNNFGNNLYGYNEFDLRDVGRHQTGHFSPHKYRNVRRRVKDRRQWPARRLDLLRAWQADLVVSEARRHRDRRPQHEVYYNRHRDLYYYSDLDPYSVLGVHHSLTFNILGNFHPFQDF